MTTTPRDLFESAQLDALGLLDGAERVRFEASLNDAPPALRAQVEAERARFADLREYLPDVSPPPELRGRVVQAVVDAAEESRRVRHAGGDRRVRPLLRGARVSPVWRGACIGFAAAALTLGLSTLFLWGEHNRLERDFSNSALVQSVVENFGVEYVQRALFDLDTQRTVFQTVAHPEGQERSAQASIWRNPGWTESRLFCIELPGKQGGQVYRVVTLDDDDRVITIIAEFRSTGALVSSDLPDDLGGATRIGIVSGADVSREPEVLLVAEFNEETTRL